MAAAPLARKFLDVSGKIPLRATVTRESSFEASRNGPLAGRATARVCSKSLAVRERHADCGTTVSSSRLAWISETRRNMDPGEVK